MTVETFQNSRKIKDFYKMVSSFLELANAYDKAIPVIAKEENGVVPKFYIKILAEI